MLRLALLLLSLCAISLRSAVAPLAAGELLVSYGDQILRIDPDTGAYSTFSPPPAGTNLLGPFGTEAIAIDPDGAIFVVSNEQVIRINPATGAQRELTQGGYLRCPTASRWTPSRRGASGWPTRMQMAVCRA